jgi:hypothetical protein
MFSIGRPTSSLVMTTAFGLTARRTTARPPACGALERGALHEAGQASVLLNHNEHVQASAGAATAITRRCSQRPPEPRRARTGGDSGDAEH